MYLILTLLHYQVAPVNYLQLKEQLLALKTKEQRLEKAAEVLVKFGIEAKPEDIAIAADAFIAKCLMMHSYRVCKKFQGDIALIRAEEMIIKSETHLGEDYNVSEVCLTLAQLNVYFSITNCLPFHLQLVTGKCDLHILPGNHKSFILNNVEQVSTLLNGKL